MSTVAEEITRISGCREDIKTAIAAKGVTVPTGAKLADCPALIASITGGGGPSEPTAMINTGFTATGYKSAYVPFTATQISVPQYDTITTTITASYQLQSQGFTADFPSGTETGVFSAQIGEWTTIDPTTGDFFRQTPDYTRVGYWSADRTTTTSVNVYMYFSVPNAHNGDASYLLMNMSFIWAMTNPGDISASYSELTGYDYPYTSYPVTTTGYVQNTVELKEYFTAGNVKFSGNNQKIVSYDSSPSDSTANTTPTANVTAFWNAGLKNWQTLSTAAIDDNYTYLYGTSGSGYSGYTSI